MPLVVNKEYYSSELIHLAQQEAQASLLHSPNAIADTDAIQTIA
jgi:hypothetical protein